MPQPQPPRAAPRVFFGGLDILVMPVLAADPPAGKLGQVPEPSQEVIGRLNRERIDWLNQESAKYFGEGAKKLVIPFERLQKSDCESELKGAYQCRALIDSAFGKCPSETRRKTLTLTHDGHDWRLR